jgi:methanethiol S-methyltransferase
LWPTLLTLLMFPVLVVRYVRLAHHEEQDALRQFGDEYRRYMDATPGWVLGLQLPRSAT